MDDKVKNEKKAKQGFFGSLIDKLDKRLKEKAKNTSSCCGGDKKDPNGSSCCK